MTADKNLEIIGLELQFIARQMRKIEGANSDEFDAIDEINMALNSARRALEEYNLSMQPACEEIPAGVALPEAA